MVDETYAMRYARMARGQYRTAVLAVSLALAMAVVIVVFSMAALGVASPNDSEGVRSNLRLNVCSWHVLVSGRRRARGRA